MKKVLFTSHVANFVKFNKPFMQWFQQQGWEVHYASLDEEFIPYCNKHFRVDFNRSPFSFDNVTAYFQLKKIVQAEHYDIIHCHTPMGGVVTRLAALAVRKSGTKVMYTAHGFHFYKGAPVLNWLLYYPMEKLLSFVTDCLITMNEEDYRTALRHHFGAGRIEKIDGVGVDLSRFHPVSVAEKLALREEFGFGREEFILIYVAEFIARKNHRLLVESLPLLAEKIPGLRVVFAGRGATLEHCKQYAQDLGVFEFCSFLGYCNNVERLYSLSDLLVTTSRQEGLPINVIEGMACGLSVVCTDIRGHVDVIKPGRNGFLFPIDNKETFTDNVFGLFSDVDLRETIGSNNLVDVQVFSQQQAVARMAEIYRHYL